MALGSLQTACFLYCRGKMPEPCQCFWKVRPPMSSGKDTCLFCSPKAFWEHLLENSAHWVRSTWLIFSPLANKKFNWEPSTPVPGTGPCTQRMPRGSDSGFLAWIQGFLYPSLAARCQANINYFLFKVPLYRPDLPQTWYPPYCPNLLNAEIASVYHHSQRKK